MAKRDYQREIKSMARGAWAGLFTFSEFQQGMQAIIERRIPQAFLAGARECGIRSLDNLNFSERAQLRNAIIREINWIGTLWEWIWNNRRATGGKLKPILRRANLWGNRWLDVKNRAKWLVCQDIPLEWILGPTEQHCPDCAHYDGKVYRASVWRLNGIRPQDRGLACCGYNCLCQLVKTDKRLTPGVPKAKSGCPGRSRRGEFPLGPFPRSKRRTKK